jgi:hypothetical protein
MAKFTIAYSEKNQGFPSFYSYEPESMIGMNNRFFSFKSGELYIHNSNEVNRNSFYDVDNDTNVKVVFNKGSLENKIFKTVNLEGTHPWKVAITSDIQDTGTIESSWFVPTEGSHRAFVRNTGGAPIGAADLPLRSMNGIGRTSSHASFGDIRTAQFEQPSINNAAVGDKVYYAQAADGYEEIKLWGTVTLVGASGGFAILNFDVEPGAVEPTTQSAYVLIAKNAIAESHGVIGHYGIFDLTNSSTTATELVAVETEVMISKA